MYPIECIGEIVNYAGKTGKRFEEVIVMRASMTKLLARLQGTVSITYSAWKKKPFTIATAFYRLIINVYIRPNELPLVRT